MQNKILLFLFLFLVNYATTVWGQMSFEGTANKSETNSADRRTIRTNITNKLKTHFSQNISGNFEVIDFDVFFQGNLALVCYTAQNSKTNTGIYRLLDVYGKQNGQWIEISSNSGQDHSALISVSPEARQIILAAREKVWRAWFTNDKAALEKAIPQEIIAISSGQGDLTHYPDVMKGSEEFVKGGSKLVKLEFPKDEIQVYGSMIILYTTFLFEIENKGVRKTTAGRATDMFVVRNGNFVNVGWHLDSGK